MTQYISAAQLAKRYGVHKSTIWRWSAKRGSDFPRPVRPSDQVTRWRLDEIEKYETERTAGAA